MLSNSSKYAIKGVLYLALNSNESHKIMVRDIFEVVHVPEAYLAKLLQELSRHGIISSVRGPKGGFYLSEDDRKRTLMDIVRVIDGEKRVHSCVMGMRNCDMDNPCVLHKLVGANKSKFINVLENTTILDLVEGKQNIEEFFPL
ncbi:MULTISPECIES: RrF2 family transcriptional regulator [Flavobacteriaceae]|uniref:Rrf2 family transcriptional regulator n=1 Tax=Flagellimonas halotolerans TaxID=3112164 RepID=A0ABU6ITE8_9FLAO|nr:MULTISPECIES: Rrf2 family transcriptional regulator [unclassified Allomuricauda]MEC3966401.1 Rrf2 family transcriptional regulator [Muricauda sp. SYSU M86414]MEC4266266.1 Rrf2 family transcriptional regulator [Muricauda sp. SYSU M84420]NDV16702.1 Rrf2 family transcriptional regulator [Muricauda sp. TY007]